MKYKLNIEIMTMYAASILIFRGVGTESFRLLLIGAVLIELSGKDIERHRLPDELILVGCAVSLLRLFEGVSISELAAGIIPAILLLALVLVCDFIDRRSTMGGGDIKMIAMLGLNFGLYRNLIIILLAGIMFAAVYLLNDRKEKMPFGPMLSVASWIAALM